MKDALRFLWDADAPEDSKVLRLRARFGMEGYGVFQALTCKMRKEANYSISCDDLDIYAGVFGIELERFTAIVDCCVSVGLFCLDGSELFAPALRGNMAVWDAKKQRRSEAARKARGVQLDNRQQPPQKQEQAPTKKEHAHVTDRRSNTIQDNTIQNNPIQRGGVLGGAEPASQQPPPLTDFDAWAARMLEPVDEAAPWANSEPFISTGRRPMRKYPAIAITEMELADVLRQAHALGLPVAEFPSLALLVESQIKTPPSNGLSKRFGVNAYSWFTGWALKNKLEVLKMATQKRNVEENSYAKR